MSYKGAIVTIPLGQYGLLTDHSPSDLPMGALIQAKNVVLNEGLIQKAPGSYKYNPNNQLAKIVGLWDWNPSLSIQRMIAVTSTGSIYKDLGDGTFNGSLAINTSLGNLTPRCSFVQGGNETAGRAKKLFFFSDGEHQLEVMDGDGAAFAEITLPAADWTPGNYPRVGITHRNRLWAFQDQRGYASTTGDHEDFQAATILTQNIYPGEGGDIIGAYIFKGRLFVFKEGNFIYYLEDQDTSSTNWYWRKLAGNFGLASPNAITTPIDDLFAGDNNGSVISQKATETLGDIESSDVFRIAQVERYIKATTHPVGLPYMHSIYDEQLKQVYYTSRSTYTNENDMLINIDLNGQMPRITYLQKGTPTCLAVRKDAYGAMRPIYGSSDGYVHIMNYEDRLEGSTAYEGSFQTAYTDFKAAAPELSVKQKQFDFLWVEFVEEGEFDLSIDVYIDGKFVETTSTKMILRNDEITEFLLGTDRTAQYTTISNPIPLHGMGRRISFRCYNAGSNQSFRIASLSVGFRPTHEGFTIF